MIRRILLSAMLFAASTGCAGFEYVVQAGMGQLDLSARARDLETAARDDSTPPRIRALLGEVAGMKRFAVEQGLTPTRSYTKYVDVDRPAAVWVVTACEPLRFRMKSWHFPVVGSVPYLGWFDRDDADDFAADLRADGWDTDTRGAVAYSTLGYFHDPVISSMIPEGAEATGELVDTVLHESVHATVYVNGQTPLNESVASFVAGDLTRVWLDAHRGPTSVEKRAYVDALARRERRAKAMFAAYKELEAVYESSRTREEKLAEKARLLARIRVDLGFKRPINNATLVQSRAYHSAKVELRELLVACGGSFPRFLASVKGLGPGAFSEPHQKDFDKLLTKLARAGCPSTTASTK